LLLTRDYRDVIAGLLMIFIGLGAAGYAWAFYRLGTIMQMGPGMFPFGLGILLALLGVLILLPALFRAGPQFLQPDLRSFFFVGLALVAFAMTVRWLGLIPAVVLLVMTAAFADNKLGLPKMVALSVALSAIAWFVFIYALGIPLQSFIWPRS
jgi:hypothetical protein